MFPARRIGADPLVFWLNSGAKEQPLPQLSGDKK
jgi:hypothetical protein